ncbi:MAG TPA: YkgJ family cysteine cluster protein [Methanoculleus sp.]|nr:YkgJ family cysteine cluster protein [Methanoculleus sp.]
MNTTTRLGEEIKKTGFVCRRCGRCCAGGPKDGNEVIVSPDEIRTIMGATGLEWNEIADPYPEFIDDPSGASYTLAWCLKRTARGCIFFGEDCRCTIYDHRPSICRTYPFMLQDGCLCISECPGLGDEGAGGKEAEVIARDLLARSAMEETENEKTAEVFSEAQLAKGDRCVIDSEGVTFLHG